MGTGSRSKRAPARCGRAPLRASLLGPFRLRLSSLDRLRDRHPLAVGFIVRWLVAEIDIGNAGLPPDIVNVRHGEAAGVMAPCCNARRSANS